MGGGPYLAARLAVVSQAALVPQKISTLCLSCTVSRASRAAWSKSWEEGWTGRGMEGWLQLLAIASHHMRGGKGRTVRA